MIDSTIIRHYASILYVKRGVILVDFGSTLKELRTQAGMTQQQLGDLIGVTKSVISFYELQERCPSPETLKRIAAVFHVSTDFLLGIEKKPIVTTIRSRIFTAKP